MQSPTQPRMDDTEPEPVHQLTGLETDHQSGQQEGPLRIDLARVPSSTPKKIKLLRVLWACFQLPFASWTPKALSPLRVALLKLFGARLSPHVEIGAGVKVWCPWNLTMGERSSIGFEAEIYNFAPVTIGRHVVVSQYTYICTATHDFTHPYFPLVSSPIEIRSQAWVAAGCLISPGVVIGEGTVIGARSLVTRDMPAWTVCAGSPCKPLKPRIIRPIESA